jgi:hypothetical protein
VSVRRHGRGGIGNVRDGQVTKGMSIAGLDCGRALGRAAMEYSG